MTIDRGYSDVMRLNKQLSDCVLEIEEHTMKLQLLNKQLKIAKESLEVAQAKQQEIKNKVHYVNMYVFVDIIPSFSIYKAFLVILYG